ncbi:MAG TPA: glycosyltransferase [Candidatus Competibacter sp.]|nr:glycosyltransferase [Candidatus Competibacter sp.]
MKILMLSDVYFPRVNGVSTSIQTFRRELQGLGHEVWLVAPEYGQPVVHEQGIERVISRQVLFDPEDRMMRPRLLAQQLAMLRSCKFDLIHVQTPFVAHYAGLRLARRLGVPCVETYHTFFEEYLFHYLPFLPKGVWRVVARQCFPPTVQSVGWLGGAFARDARDIGPIWGADQDAGDSDRHARGCLSARRRWCISREA